MLWSKSVRACVCTNVRMVWKRTANLSPPIPPIESIEFSKKHSSCLVLLLRRSGQRNWNRQQLPLRLIDDFIVFLVANRCQSENENW